jgi:hypothetical protein
VTTAPHGNRPDDDRGTSQKGPIAHAHFAVMVGADAHAA